MSPPTLRYRNATPADVPAVVALVNSAYRGDSSRLGWTTEADLLDGQRTDAEEISELISRPNSLILLALLDQQLLGSVHLARQADGAYLGMFTVRPGWQGQGIGKVFLATAERTVRERFAADCLRMTVIDRRSELIAFYERRGYRRTGRFNPFPDDVRYGIPRVTGLRMELLEKALCD
jgi:ribosomal protein S18 acetylase RimI-like enzyme